MRKIIFLILGMMLLSLVIVNACEDGAIQECGTDVGVCEKGSQTCSNGKWGVCKGDIIPIKEVCEDQLDNNCDGSVDENCFCIEDSTQECGTDVGVCEKGIEICVNDSWTGCDAIAGSPIEYCDNRLDDNCDGYIDQEDSSCGLLNHCTNQIKDQDEEGVDCGGNDCPQCVNCSDGQVGFGEVGIDCGDVCGINCCSNVYKDTDLGEEGVDCGGNCNPCIVINTDSDDDGLSDSEEIALGTDLNNPNSDDDGINDKLDDFPLCPNKVCDVNFGETKENCKDCRNYTIYYLIGLSLLVILIILIYISTRKKNKKVEKSIIINDNSKKPVMKIEKRIVFKKKNEDPVLKRLKEEVKPFK